MIKLNVRKIFIILLSFLTVISSSSHSVEADDMVLERAIGHLILYQTERQINGRAGINSPLTEVFKTYYEHIESLPVDKRAMFLFMADMNLKVHGGSNLIHFYDFVYLCCLNEYIQLVESNISNRYLNSDLLKRKLSNVKYLGASVKKQATWRERSLEEHKEIMKAEFVEMIQIVKNQEAKMNSNKKGQ